MREYHRFLFFGGRPIVVEPAPPPRPRPVAFFVAFPRPRVGFGDVEGAIEGSRISASSSSTRSVPGSVAVTTLAPLGDSAPPSSPLSCVSALLSLSPPTSPAILSFVRLRFFPPRGLDTGEGSGDEGGDGVERARRSDIAPSNHSSYGIAYSSRKNG